MALIRPRLIARFHLEVCVRERGKSYFCRQKENASFSFDFQTWTCVFMYIKRRSCDKEAATLNLCVPATVSNIIWSWQHSWDKTDGWWWKRGFGDLFLMEYSRFFSPHYWSSCCFSCHFWMCSWYRELFRSLADVLQEQHETQLCALFVFTQSKK